MENYLIKEQIMADGKLDDKELTLIQKILTTIVNVWNVIVEFLKKKGSK